MPFHKPTRRSFLGYGSQMALTTTLFGNALAKAIQTPANHRTGSIEDVEHVVILMQENRSFDHYFGTLGGVRGFADPRPVNSSRGESIWRQSYRGQEFKPFHFDSLHTSFPVMPSLSHDWMTAHMAWNEGCCDRWIEAKTPLTMGYLTRADIPYHFALADAFTVCDAYHSSLLGPTCPNRLYFLTGSVDPTGRGGGPVIDNDNATQRLGGKVYTPQWKTYVERLEAAGVSWQAYRQGEDPASDDDSDGGMNLLLAFDQFRQAREGTPLFEKGVRPRRLETLKEDVVAGRLPKVSWIFPPRLFCEHPSWPPAFGVEYIARILDALTSNPEVWSKTVFLVAYDENDGFFDHLPPPVAPLSGSDGHSTEGSAGEQCTLDGKPLGLGYRVPLLVMSPWSRGGFVNSEVFDHTSILRFLERRFRVPVPDISPWRRSVCGDLSSAFDFSNSNQQDLSCLAHLNALKRLPSQVEFDQYRHSVLQRPVPKIPQKFENPIVETQRRPARPLGYEMAVDCEVRPASLALEFSNTGSIGASFYVYDLAIDRDAPKRFTIGSGKSISASWPLNPIPGYELRVAGPNGFDRYFRSNRDKPEFFAKVKHRGDTAGLEISLCNSSKRSLRLSIYNAYTRQAKRIKLKAGAAHAETLPLIQSDLWYDLTISSAHTHYRYCGHVETGLPSTTDPAIQSLAQQLASQQVTL